ncbi:MAG: hypothetical protein RL497_2692 [Pseudomonadota bacterium]|jgi:hypothetical protein
MVELRLAKRKFRGCPSSIYDTLNWRNYMFLRNSTLLKNGVGFLFIAMGVCTLAQSAVAAGDPYKLTLKMERFPHGQAEIHAFLKWGPCVMPSPAAFPPSAYSGDAGVITAPLVDHTLTKKCRNLADKFLADTRLEIIENCAEGESTIMIRHKACSGQQPINPGDGISLAMANSVDALSQFVSGSFLADYERDTIIPDSVGDETSGNGAVSNMIILKGTATGVDLVDSGQSEVEIKVSNIAGTGTITAITSPSAGLAAQNVVASLKDRLNSTFALFPNDPVRCDTAQLGNIIRCTRPAGFPQPKLSLSSSDTGISKAMAGGGSKNVQDVINAITNGTCSNILSGCQIGGQLVKPLVTTVPPSTTPVPVPVPFWALGFLAAFLAVFGIKNTASRKYS